MNVLRAKLDPDPSRGILIEINKLSHESELRGRRRGRLVNISNVR